MNATTCGCFAICPNCDPLAAHNQSPVSMSVNTAPIEATVSMSTTADIQHMCPFVHEVDNGKVTIGWDAEGWTFELHALRGYLNTFQEREISHEDLTDEIRAELSGHHGINNVTVNTSWRTAGMEVQCSTSPTPVGLP